MLQRIDPTGFFSNSNDDYYFDKNSRETLVLYEREKDKIRFFSPNTFSVYECSDSQYEKLVKNEKLIKAKYVLAYSFTPADSLDVSRSFVASDTLNRLYERLVNIAYHHQFQKIEFKACYIKDLQNGSYVLKGNQISDLKEIIQQQARDQKPFVPTPINVNQVLSSVGIKPIEASSSQQKSKSR